MTTVRACRGGPGGSKKSLIADQRGVVSLEMPAVFLFLLLSVLVPLADVAIAGLHYIFAWEALRAFGEYLQYNPPPDVTNAGNWQTAAVAKADSRYPIANFKLVCGDSQTACSATNAVSPKYYSYTTSVTLTPLLLKKVLCTSNNTNPCTITMGYSERFQ